MRSSSPSGLARCAALLLGVSVLGACSGAQSPGGGAPVNTQGPWAIRLHRPERAGARFHVTGTGRHHMVTEVSQGAARLGAETEERAVRFEFDETVRELNARGKAVSVEYEVVSFASTNGAQAGVTLRAGQRIAVRRAAREDQATVTVDGQPATAEQRAAIDLALELTAREDGPQEDEVFGTTQPQAVGGRWAANGALATSDLRSHTGLQIELTGEFSVRERARVGATDCLVLEGSLHGPVRALPSLPPGGTLREATLEVRLTGAFPLDPSLPQLRTAEALTMDATLELNRGGQAATVHVRSVDERSEERVPR